MLKLTYHIVHITLRDADIFVEIKLSQKIIKCIFRNEKKIKLIKKNICMICFATVEID